MNLANRAVRPKFRYALIGLFPMMFAILSSCASPRPVQVSVLGNESMNSGYPVLVCLYQLKSDTNFMRIPLESFWADREKEFAADLVEPGTEIMLAPGETKWVPLQASKETNYIGAAADFRRPDNKGWRLVYDLAVKRPKEIWLTVTANRIEIEKTK
jgi:type VI secretion system protein VasD